MLALLAVTFAMFDPALPNRGYVDVLAPTNPIPYASRFKGEVFGNTERFPRVEDMVFTYQMAFERYIVKRLGINTQRYSGAPLVVEPSRFALANFGEVTMFGFLADQVSSGLPVSDFRDPAPVPADMIGYAMDDVPNAGFFAVDTDKSSAGVIPSIFEIPNDFYGDGVDYVQERVASSMCFDREAFLVLTNTIRGLPYRKADLLDLCRLADDVTTYFFAGGGGTLTNSVDASYTWRNAKWWHPTGAEDTGEWLTTNIVSNTTNTNPYGTFSYVASAYKEATKYYWTDTSTGEIGGSVSGEGNDRFVYRSAEQPSPLTAVLCSGKSFYWDYERLGDESERRQGALRAYAVFHAEGQAMGMTSVRADRDTELFASNRECWVVASLGLGTPSTIPHVEIGDGYTNKWCDIRYTFSSVDLDGIAASACSYFGWDGVPGVEFPQQPNAPVIPPSDGGTSTVMTTFLQYDVSLELEDLFGFVRYNFLTTIREEEETPTQAQEGANDNP